MTIKIQKSEDGKLLAFSPYNPNLPKRARALGGKWNSKAWVFDARDESRVRDLYKEIYGEDGSETTKKVSIKITVKKDWSECCNSIFLCGRVLARAFGRDSGAKLGDGVVLLEGVVKSGGSAKYWDTIIKAGSVMILRDIPEEKAKEAMENKPSEVEEISIIEEQTAPNAAVKEETESKEQHIQRLLNRIAELRQEEKQILEVLEALKK